jgi:hypothetical protein
MDRPEHLRIPFRATTPNGYRAARTRKMIDLERPPIVVPGERIPESAGLVHCLILEIFVPSMLTPPIRPC